MTQQCPPKSSEPGAVAWYFVQDDAQVGPVSEASLLDAVNTGKIIPDTLVWQLDFENWVEAIEIPLLATHPLFCKPRHQRALPQPFPEHPESTMGRANAKPTASELAPSIPDPISESGHTLPDLGDALTDDEAVETTIDVAQAREILQRTSTYPPGRSIPPASHTTPPSSGRSPILERFFRVPERPIVVGAGVLSVAITAVFVRCSHVESRDFDNVRPLSPQVLKAPLAETTSAPVSSQSTISAVRVTRPPSPTTTKAAVIRIESGPLEPSLFESKLQRARPVFDAQCWIAYRVPGRSTPKNPSIDVSLSIDRFGNVYDVSSSKAPPSYRGAGLCIIGRIRGWKFPHAERGTHATLTVARFAE